MSGPNLRWILLVFTVLLVPLSHSTAADSLRNPYYQPQKVYEFAEHLYREGEYVRAAGEFRSLFHRYPSSSADSLWLRLGLCYYRAGQYSESSEITGDLLQKSDSDGSAFGPAYSLMVFNYLHQNNYAGIDSLSRSVTEGKKREMDNGKYFVLQGVSSFYAMNWEHAEGQFTAALRDYTLQEPLRVLTQDYLRSLKKIGNLKEKKPAIAGGLSALIPGLGKVYLGRPGDALFSFVTIGVLGYNAYSSFSSQGFGSVYGWLNAIPAISFYFGNVYGSVTGAFIHNRQQINNIMENVEFPEESYFIRNY